MAVGAFDCARIYIRSTAGTNLLFGRKVDGPLGEFMSTKQYWLMKTEPDVFSFEDLMKAPRRTTFWEGVRNYQARNFMRDQFKIGQKVLIYHSNTEAPGVVGVAEVVREAYPDPSALDRKSDYYDERAAKKNENSWVMVDVRAIQTLKTPITREAMAKHPVLKGMDCLKKGNRLSIQPVTAEQFQCVLKVGKAESI